VNGSRKLPPDWSSVLVACCCCSAEVPDFESVRVAAECDDVGVVHEPVDHGGDDHFVAEDFAPAADWLVAGDDQAGAFIAARGELEERGSSDSTMGRSSSLWSLAVSGEHDSQPIVMKVFKAMCQATDLLDD
jgi:hypothetical protein